MGRDPRRNGINFFTPCSLRHAILDSVMHVSSPARWGVLVYSSASPDIEPACRDSFDDVARAMPVDGVAVAGWLGTSDATRQLSPTGDVAAAPVDMSRPETLERFVQWGMKAVPAERYMVVLGGHGSGFMGAVTDPTRQHIMAPQQMRDALARGGIRADVLVLNACLEANVEVAAELAPRANVLVASQGLQQGAGIPLGAAIERLRADTTPIEAARAVIDASCAVPDRAPILSAVDERRVGDVVRAFDVLGSALLADPVALSAARAQVEALPDFRERPHDRPLVDLKDVRAFARGLAGDARLRGTPAAAAAGALDRAVGAAVVSVTPSSEGVGAAGLSAYLPVAPMPLDWVQRQYDGLAFSREAPRWHGAVERLGGSAVNR